LRRAAASACTSCRRWLGGTPGTPELLQFEKKIVYFTIHKQELLAIIGVSISKLILWALSQLSFSIG
jgi:hypothetical protein